MWKNYLTIAWRNMTRHKLYTFINVIGLAVGICSCLAIWTITNYELSFDTFHPNTDRVYRLTNSHKQISGDYAHWGNLCEPAAPQMRKEMAGFETVAQFRLYRAAVTIPGDHGQQKKIPVNYNSHDWIFAEPQYFDIFKYEWITGNPASLDQPFHIVLTTAEAQRYFGTNDYPAIMGRTLIYDDSIHVTVTGIVKDWNKPTDFGFKDMISYATLRATGLKNELGLDNWHGFSSNTQSFVRLQKGVSPGRIEAQLIPFAEKYIDDKKENEFRIHLQPLG